MKKMFSNKLLLSALFFCFCMPLFAQLGMHLVLNRRVYMQYEPVYACLSLRNNSGKTLIFGQDPKLQGFIYFLIVDRNGRTIAKRPGREISTTGLVLRPGETRSLVLQIGDFYELDNPGSYSVNVCVAHNMLSKEYKCRVERNFVIETGVEVWSAKVGIPDLNSQNPGALTSKERRYSIRLLTEEPHKHYYLFVEDDKMVYGVSRLGKKCGFEKIKAETDMLGRIHLLIPMSSKVFHYLTFSLDGTNTGSSYWKTTRTIPTIYRDKKSGFVRRVGGEEAKRGVDYVIPEAVTASKIMSGAANIAEGMINLNDDVPSNPGALSD